MRHRVWLERLFAVLTPKAIPLAALSDLAGVKTCFVAFGLLDGSDKFCLLQISDLDVVLFGNFFYLFQLHVSLPFFVTF